MTAFARRQRVEVAHAVAGLTVFDVGTVIDLPTEECVRVELDEQPGVAKVYDADLVRSIPEAVSRHITRLLTALGAVSDDEQAEVESELRRRVGQHTDLIGFARGVADVIGATGPAKRPAHGVIEELL